MPKLFAFSQENASSHPSLFIGPTVAGALVQAFETGILVNQSVRFWSRASDEHRVIKGIVTFVSVLAAFQTAIAFFNVWRVTVLNFGDWLTVLDLQWYDRIQPALTSALATPVQAFLIWRCWNVIQRRWIIAPLVMLLLATMAVNIFITVQVFNISMFTVLLTSNYLPLQFVTAYVLSAVIDIIITALMLWFLWRAKSQVVSRRFHLILGRLLMMLWEAAVPPCACAIVTCIVYITSSNENYWDVFCQSILAKLYVISLFVILNGRADLKDIPHPPASAGLTRYWISGAAEVRVHLSRTGEQDSSDNDMTPQREHFMHEHRLDDRAWDKIEMDARAQSPSRYAQHHAAAHNHSPADPP